MDEKQLFALALGLNEPWYIERIEFDPGKRRLDLFLEFKKGARFLCPECGSGDGELCSVHDTKERTWRHLDFFQHQAYLTARVPRVTCSTHGVHQVNVPWARAGSGFTLLFEALALCMAKEMTVAGLAKVMGCGEATLWRILARYVTETVAREDYSGLKALGVDECSKRRGHQYITTFCDLDASRVVHVEEGRDHTVFRGFVRFLEDHGVPGSQVTEICMDMWEGYLKGAQEELPHAEITFDRYHLMVLMNRAVDLVRRSEVKNKWSRGARFLLLRNPETLTARQRSELERIKSLDSKTARAYHIKLALRRLWEQPTPEEAEKYLRQWYFWATHSRLEPVINVAKTIKRHWQGVLRFFTSRITSGIVEGLNSKIKTAMKRAYGFKKIEYLRTVIYLVAGKLNFPSPTQC
jgi:transposase